MSNQRQDQYDNTSPRSRRTPVDAEEDKVWIGFYRQVHDTVVALDLIQYFEANPEARDRHPGLYLKAKQSVRRGWERRASAKRVVQFIGIVADWTFVKPCRMAIRAGGWIGHVALDMLPDMRPTAPASARKPSTGTASPVVDTTAETVSTPSAPAAKAG